MNVINPLFGTGEDIYVPRNSGKAPEVLVLQISSVTPAENLKGNEILTATHIFRNVKTGLKLAVLAISDLLAVDPHTHIGRCRAYVKENVISAPACVQIESAPVLADIIMLICRYRRIVLVMSAPRISHIDIYRVPVSVQFPHPGHRHCAP